MLQTFNDARSFLQRVLPWSADEANTYKCIHWTFKPKDKAQKLLTGGSSQKLDDLMEMIQLHAGHVDVYTALASFKMADVTAKTVSGRDRRFSKPTRTQANVSAIKCLYLDLDVSQDLNKNAYRDQDEALTGLVQFVRDARLPAPNLVVASGGGGFHVYWVLDRPLSLQIWQPLANALAEATKPERHNLLCDRQVTVDGARILRVPNTFNWKTGLPLPVTIIRSSPENYTYESILQALTPYLTAAAARQTKETITGMAAKFAEGVDESSPPVDIRNTATRCAVLGEALTTGGAAFAQPLWHLTMLASAFAIDGRAVAHEMSKGHPNYTTKETDEMFDRKVRERQDRGLGWPKCSTFSRESTHCAQCPHFPADKTPFHFPTSSTSLPIENDLPAGYFRGADRSIWVNTIDKDGEPTSFQVMPYDISNAWMQEDPNRFHFELGIPGGSTRDCSVDVEFTANSHELGSILPGMGIFVKEQQIRPIREFVVAYQNTLQQIKAKQFKSVPFGWNEEKTGFTYNGRTWDGVTLEGTPAAHADPQLQRDLKVRGDMKKWRDVVECILERKNPQLEIILAAAFAAPLVALAGQKGTILAPYSHLSGAAKTTAMCTAAAVWGRPRKIMAGLTDTGKSAAAKMGNIRSLPLLWDEIKGENIDNLVRMIFQVDQGKENSRLNQRGQLQIAKEWQTMMVTACNDSLIDVLTKHVPNTDAQIYRIFEFVVPKLPPTRSSAVVLAMENELEVNHGHAGLIYAKYLGSNIEALKELTQRTSTTIEQMIQHDVAERFWISSMACTLVGASIAKDLGLVDFDLEGIKTALFEAHSELRKERLRITNVNYTAADNAEDILGAYIGSIQPRNLLITNGVPKTAGKPPKFAIHNRNIDQLQNIVGQLGIDDGILRFMSQHFSAWCKVNKHSRSAVMRELGKSYRIKPVQGKLGGGTHLSNPALMHLIEIELTKDQIDSMNLGITSGTSAPGSGARPQPAGSTVRSTRPGQSP